MGSIATLYAELGLDTSPFRRSLDNTLKHSKGIGKKMGSVLKTGALAGVAGIGAIGAATGAVAAKGISDFISFEEQMNEVFTLIPDASMQMKDSMISDVQDFSAEFGVLPEKTVPALYQALSAGVPKNNVFEFLENAQKAAKGGVTDLETAVKGTASVTNAYGSDVIDATKASDIMFTTVKNGITTFPELASNLSDVTPMAAATGVAFEDVGAALATITSQGTPTAQATTQLRQLMVELSDSGTEVGGVFEDIADTSFQDFMAEGNNVQDALMLLSDHAAETNTPIQQLFGNIRAGQAAMQLTGKNAETFSKNLEMMENSAGATNEAWEQMRSGLKDMVDRFKALWKVGLLKVAEALEPLTNRFREWIDDVMPKVQEWLGKASEAVAGFLDILLGSGPASQKLNDMKTLFKDVFGDDLGTRIGNVVQLVWDIWNALSMILEGSADNIDFWTEIFELMGFGEETAAALGATFYEIGVTINKVMTWVAENFELVKGALIGIAAILGGGAIIGIIMGVIGAIGTLVSAILSPVGLIVGAVALIYAAWVNNWGGIQEKAQAVWAFLKPILTQLGQWLGENIPKAMAALSAFWEDTLKPALEEAGTWVLEKALPAYKEFGAFLREKITAAFTTVSDFWNDTLKPALVAMKDYWETNVTPTLEAADEVLTELGEVAMALIKGAWENKVKPALEGMYEWFADNVNPILEDAVEIAGDVATAIRDTLGKAINKFKDGALADLNEDISALTGFLRSAREWLGKLATKLQNVVLPDWAIRRSPSPIELVFMNTGEHVETLARKHLPKLNMELASSPAIGNGAAPNIRYNGRGAMAEMNSGGIEVNVNVERMDSETDVEALAYEIARKIRNKQRRKQI